MKGLYILASVALAFSASSFAAELTAEVPKGDPEFIAKSLTAAPAEIGKNATVVRIADGFKLTTVKEGTNGWTCTVPPDGAPWCTDAAGMEFFKAICTQAEPPDKTGFVYMLAGDNGTSNHDPYATDKSHGQDGSARDDRRQGGAGDGGQLPEQGGRRFQPSLGHVSRDQVSAPDAPCRHSKRPLAIWAHSTAACRPAAAECPSPTIFEPANSVAGTRRAVCPYG